MPNGDVQNGSSLTSAALKGNVALCKHLISLGTDLEQVTDDGRTALFIGVEQENWEVCKVLIGAGAAVDSPDKRGRTPLLLASKQQDLEIYRLLVDNVCKFMLRQGNGFVGVDDSGFWRHVLTEDRAADFFLLSGQLPDSVNRKQFVVMSSDCEFTNRNPTIHYTCSKHPIFCFVGLFAGAPTKISLEHTENDSFTISMSRLLLVWDYYVAIQLTSIIVLLFMIFPGSAWAVQGSGISESFQIGEVSRNICLCVFGVATVVCCTIGVVLIPLVWGSNQDFLSGVLQRLLDFLRTAVIVLFATIFATIFAVSSMVMLPPNHAVFLLVVVAVALHLQRLTFLPDGQGVRRAIGGVAQQPAARQRRLARVARQLS